MASFEITKLSAAGHVKVKNVDNNKYFYYSGSGTTAKLVNNMIVIDPENDDTHVSINVIGGVDTITYSGTTDPFTGTADDPVDHCDFLNTYCFFDPAGSSGPGGTLPAGTSDKNVLVWNASIGEWQENQFAKLGYDDDGGAPPGTPDLSGQITNNFGYFRYGNSGFQWITHPYIYAGPTTGLTAAENTVYRNPISGATSIRRVVETSLGGGYNNLDQEEYIPSQGHKLFYEKAEDYRYRRYVENESGIFSYVRQIAGGYRIGLYDGNDNTTTYTGSEISTLINFTTFIINETSISYDCGTDVAYLNINPAENEFGGSGFSYYQNNDYTLITGGNYTFLVGTEATYSTLGIGYGVAYANATLVLGGYIGSNVDITATGVDTPSVLYSCYDVGLVADSDTGVQVVNSLGLGGKGYNVACPNTAYSAGTGKRWVCLDAGGTGYTLDMTNDPISGLVLLTDIQADFFYLPTASSKYLHLEIVVKKIGANTVTIDETAGGTLEQAAGGWGATYVLNGANNAQVTVKCVLIGGNYYWIVY